MPRAEGETASSLAEHKDRFVVAGRAAQTTCVPRRPSATSRATA